MASRVFSRAIPAFRAASRSQGRILSRRGMSSGAHDAHGSSSDTAWMIGSAAIFVPTILYLLSPAARSSGHAKEAHGHGTEGHGKTTPSPFSPPEPAVPVSEEVVRDDEGTAVPASEVESSLSKSFNEDSPKDAANAEAAGLPEAADTSKTPEPSFNADAPEQKDKPHEEPKKGTLQSDEDDTPKPTDIGVARTAAKEARLIFSFRVFPLHK
ncbi:hypothetical protein OF83DRAFT_80337 [Amylostereum chailletii]|nr:hypothetical protein OF83DRAFT_80337 [Amylostereum chailletii]